jgi:LMBR1 domain-containing protein 1
VILLIFAFLILPFAYFYHEESDNTWQVKVWRALLLTVGTSLGLVAIVACCKKFFCNINFSAFVFRNEEVPFGPDDIWWLPYIIRASDRFLGSRVFAFMFGCLMFVGLIAWVIFTAAGLAVMPISCLKPRKDTSEDEVEENEERLTDLKEQIRSMASKYELRGYKKFILFIYMD